jgi:hypothetical protein
MITRVKNWYHNLSNQWKATLRTFIQNVLGAVSIFVVGTILTLTNMLNGQAVDLVADLSNYARLSLVALLGAASALWAYVMNRNGEVAQYVVKEDEV